MARPHPESARSQQRVTLPADTMRAIKALATNADLPAGERLSGVLQLIYGWAWFVRQASIDPTTIALSNAQWLEVCSALTSGVPEDAYTDVNLGLQWMNIGPSTYED